MSEQNMHKKKKINVYIVRHGNREDWLDPRAWKKTATHFHDPPLSQAGLQQANELGAHLQHVKFHEVYSSPFLRTITTGNAVVTNATPKQTATNTTTTTTTTTTATTTTTTTTTNTTTTKIAAVDVNPTPKAGKTTAASASTTKKTTKTTATKIKLENGLSEWLEESKVSKMANEDYAQKFETLDLSHQSYLPYVPKSESAKQLHRRCELFVNAFEADLEQRLAEGNHHDEEHNILMVSHAATIIALSRSFLRDLDLRLEPGTCSLTRLSKEVGEAEWKLDEACEASFLHTGAHRTWGFDEDLQKQIKEDY
eukprot:TRINITY_DN2149_c0_g2_i1.p1 TRINITY_DN2149_c0_g2~~TRINITY_DN2149_c0_g2_i1.p1  ORF type:complete len:357 (+),score=80.58 TRINITY_DN2149_c0_g2_i1:141-1073(+)